jgi:DNA-binding IclR family transcriptional regulator
MIVKHRLRKHICKDSVLSACSGLTCAEIGKKLGHSISPMKRVLRGLVEAGLLRCEGNVQVRYWRT